MVQNVSSNEVIGIILDLFSKGFVFLLPIIGVLAGIHLLYSMIMNVLFRDRKKYARYILLHPFA